MHFTSQRQVRYLHVRRPLPTNYPYRNNFCVFLYLQQVTYNSNSASQASGCIDFLLLSLKAKSSILEQESNFRVVRFLTELFSVSKDTRCLGLAQSD